MRAKNIARGGAGGRIEEHAADIGAERLDLAEPRAADGEQERRHHDPDQRAPDIDDLQLAEHGHGEKRQDAQQHGNRRYRSDARRHRLRERLIDRRKHDVDQPGAQVLQLIGQEQQHPIDGPEQTGDAEVERIADALAHAFDVIPAARGRGLHRREDDRAQRGKHEQALLAPAEAAARRGCAGEDEGKSAQLPSIHRKERLETASFRWRRKAASIA